MQAAPKKEKQESLRRNREKWTATLMDAGWTAFPSILLERQRALGLDAMDINIILHLARHWWRKDEPPYPSKRIIAQCMGITESTVQRRIADMEQEGLIKRKYRFDPIKGQRSNEYLFDGLIEAAIPLAKEAMEDRKQRGSRYKRKYTGLRVVEQTEED